jgi:F-type H+-transporting ATPase subunit gamma
MAGLKQIKRRLGSVRNTRKITYAMKLVAAAKLRKVQEEVAGLRKFKEALSLSFARVLGELDPSELETSLNKQRPVKKVRVLVIGGFRGLAGGFNSNVNKEIAKVVSSLREQHADPELLFTVVGKKPAEYLRREGFRITKAYEKLPDSVSSWPVEDIVEGLVHEFEAAEVDKTVLVFTEFRSALSQSATSSDLLPIRVPSAGQRGEDLQGGRGICEPSPLDVYRALLPRLLRADIQYAALNSQASEHGSRMTAMDAATKNADDLAGRLRRTYNKLRQSSITAELLDIIGGAEAIS